MNVIRLGSRVTGNALDLVKTFSNARFKGAGCFRRRLDKVVILEG